jgi:hypothetical protein
MAITHKQGKCGNHKAAFNVEAHEAKVPISEFAAQRTSQRNYHGRKTDKGQR